MNFETFFIAGVLVGYLVIPKLMALGFVRQFRRANPVDTKGKTS